MSITLEDINQYGLGFQNGAESAENETKTELGLLLTELISLVTRAYAHGKSKVILNAVKSALQEV